MIRKINNIIIPSIFALLLLSSCTNNNDKFILQIEEFKLSKESFKASYNVAPFILKFGNEPAVSYLNAIKNEYLISQYLTSQGFGKDSSLSKTLRLFRQELIVEKMFKEEIDNKIVITNEEIRSEILKGKRQVKVKYIYSKDFNEAVELRKELSRGLSFDELQEKKLLKLGLSTDAGETGFINYGEVDKEINDIIFNLTPNKLSEVVKTNTGYFILKIVDIRTTILSESDILKLSPTYKKTLYNKKMYSESKAYLKEFLDPMGIVVNGKTFQKLVNVTYPIYRNNSKSNDIDLQQNQEFFKVKNYKLSKELLDEKLVAYNGGFLTVADILYHLSYYPVSFPTTSINDFANSLKNKIGLRLRDVFMEREGLRLGYENDKLIKEEIALWKNQIIMYRYLQRLSDETIIDTADVKKIYEKDVQSNVPFSEVQHKISSSYKDYLIYKKIQSQILLEKERHEIFINLEVLKEIHLPKYENILGVDLFSYKMGLPYSRLAFAVPNRIWAAENVWNSILNIK